MPSWCSKSNFYHSILHKGCLFLCRIFFHTTKRILRQIIEFRAKDTRFNLHCTSKNLSRSYSVKRCMQHGICMKTVILSWLQNDGSRGFFVGKTTFACFPKLFSLLKAGRQRTPYFHLGNCTMFNYQVHEYTHTQGQVPPTSQVMVVCRYHFMVLHSQEAHV